MLCILIHLYIIKNMLKAGTEVGFLSVYEVCQLNLRINITSANRLESHLGSSYQDQFVIPSSLAK